MSVTPPNSSSIQIPIRIHPQQPGTLRSDTGIQTGSNILQSSSINTQTKSTSTHQTNPTVIPQISSQSVQYRINQPTPIIHTTKGSPTFNVNLNAFNGVPIPPVLRPYQPPESKELSEEKDLNTNKAIIRQIYGCRQNKKVTTNIENEYLCSCADSPSIQFGKWISQFQIASDINGLKKIQEFNESTLQADFLNITSSSKQIQNSAISPVEIICQYNENYLFRFRLNDTEIFCWDHGPFSEFYENLIKDFQNRKKVQRKAPIITNGVKLILDSIHRQLGLIFCGEKSDIIEFLSVFTGKVALVTKDSEFNWWCNQFEEKCLTYVGYRGDDFSRAIIRQFQITSHTALLLLTYDSVVADFSFFDDYEFDCLIADDGERLKNPQGRKRNALQSINCKYRIVLTSKLKEDELHSIQDFVKNDEVIYFREPDNTTKYIFVRPTDYQLALLASKPFKADKICQNGFLIHPTNQDNEFDKSLNIYEKYSAKFLFLGKVAKNTKVKTVFIFKSKKLLSLCKKYLDSIEISCKTPENKEAEALIALFFYNDIQISKYEIKIAIDCNYNESHYRLILYGTREHYFLSKDAQSRNIQKIALTHIPSPPLISFEDNSKYDGLEAIIKESASLISSDLFDFQSLGISEFLEKEQIKKAIYELSQNGFQFDNQPLLLSTAIALFRAIKPENITLYPLSFFKLAKEIQINDISTFICESRKMWLDPIKTMYQKIDFTPFHELKNYFFNSSDRILHKIENKMVINNYFKLSDPVFKFEMLPPSHLATPEKDKKLLALMQQGVFPLNDQKRIENIINVMKYELISNDFHENYIFPFWTINEVRYIANEYVDFGGIVPSHKLSLFSKSSESIQNLKAEISRQLISGCTTIRINSNFSTAQKVTLTSIPQIVSIDEDNTNQLLIRLQLVKSLRAALDLDDRDAFVSCLIRSQKIEFSNDSLMSLLKGILEFGASSKNELLLSTDFSFRSIFTPSDISLLKGKFALQDTHDEESTKIPTIFTNETTFLRAVQTAIRDARNGPDSNQITEPKIQPPPPPQRTVPTMPIVSQVKPQQQSIIPPTPPSRNYSPPNELLQRAADLQNQKRFEKKKMKQMKPIISALPQKKAPPQLHPPLPPQIQINQPHFIQQLPIPVSQPPPQPLIIPVKTVDEKSASEESQKVQPPPQPQIQQPQQQQPWPRQQYFMPSVEIGRKISDSSQQQQQTTQNITQQQQQPESIVLPPKKRPISVITNSATTNPLNLQQQQNDQITPQIQSQSTPIVEPLKAAHVRMSQAAARQMINDDFLKSLPHTTRQTHSVSNVGAGTVTVGQNSPQQSTGGFSQHHFTQPAVGELQTNVSLLPLKKKHLANSPK